MNTLPYAALALLIGCAHSVPPAQRPKVERSIELAKLSLANDDFRRALGSLKPADFDHHSDTSERAGDDGNAVLNRLQSAGVPDADCYPVWNWSKQYAREGSQGRAQLACSRLDERPAAEWAGTLVHELAHQAGYLHNGQERQRNECTVPYVVGDLTEFVASSGKILAHDACPALRAAVGR